jgi:hypothetical protein
MFLQVPINVWSWVPLQFYSDVDYMFGSRYDSFISSVNIVLSYVFQCKTVTVVNIHKFELWPYATSIQNLYIPEVRLVRPTESCNGDIGRISHLLNNHMHTLDSTWIGLLIESGSWQLMLWTNNCNTYRTLDIIGNRIRRICCTLQVHQLAKPVCVCVCVCVHVCTHACTYVWTVR